MVLSLAPRGFSSGIPVFPSPQEPTRPNSNSIWNARTHLNEFLKSPSISWVNKYQFDRDGGDYDDDSGGDEDSDDNVGDDENDYDYAYSTDGHVGDSGCQ